MSERARKQRNTLSRRGRTRAKIRGTESRPRLSVKISTTNVSAQIINDESSQTLAAATSIGSKGKGTLTEQAAIVGAAIAKSAKSKKITQVVLDRGEKKYHGRIKALAEAARENGLEF